MAEFGACRAMKLARRSALTMRGNSKRAPAARPSLPRLLCGFHAGHQQAPESPKRPNCHACV
jgi:hypothetical protein